MRSKRTSLYSRRKRYPIFMAWIKTQPCMCCGARRGIEAAHCGPRAFGQKCDDRETLPLCKDDHTEGNHSHHKAGKNFWTFWDIDRDAMFKKYQAMFAEQVGVDEGTSNDNEAEEPGGYDANKKWVATECARERQTGSGEPEQAGDKESDLCG